MKTWHAVVLFIVAYALGYWLKGMPIAGLLNKAYTPK